MQTYVGQLDQRVTLESVSKTRDSGGGATKTWATYATVWAKVKPMSGREREDHARREATGDYIVVIRTRADVLEGHRIGWNGRKLNVTFVRGKGVRTNYLEIEAQLGGSS